LIRFQHHSQINGTPLCSLEGAGCITGDPTTSELAKASKNKVAVLQAGRCIAARTAFCPAVAHKIFDWHFPWKIADAGFFG
jgi:hypothetical protein